MPIYEFRCRACGNRFEELVRAGTAAMACPRCGSEEVSRAYSAPAAPFDVVRTPREMKRQERRNAVLRESTKAAFKSKLRRAREGRGRPRQEGGR